MKKKNIALIIFILIFLCSIISLHFLNINNQEKNNVFKIPVNSNQLLSRSEEGYNSVEVYQQKKQLIINARSELEFFDGAQFVLKTHKKLNSSDVEIIWTTIGGGTEKAESNERIIAEIKIKESGEIIFDKKINFLRKAFDAVEEVLDRKKGGL